MELLNLESEELMVDWLGFTIHGLPDPKRIASGLTKHFTPHVTIDKKPSISYHGFKKKYKVSILQSTGSKGYWVGTRVVFSGKNAAYFYKLLTTQKFDWKILTLDQHALTLGRIDICYSRANVAHDTLKTLDAFLVDSRSHIQNNTTTKHIKLHDYSDGKMLKVNRRNNSLHYRVYQKNQDVRFEVELKYRQTKLIQDYLFQNQIDIFEDKLVRQFFNCSGQLLRLDYPYTDWIIDFQRRYQGKPTFRPVVSSYLDNQLIKNQEEAERLFHLLQFLSFVKSLKLNPFKDCKKLKIKKQFYYELRFPLSKFLKFTGIQYSNKSEREKLLDYFSELQKLDPIVKVFSNRAFRSYVCFPYVDCTNPSGKSWIIEVVAVEELFSFPYPFQLPKSFLRSRSKNDVRLKIQFIKALAVSEKEKIMNLEEFFNEININSNRLLKIKKSMIQLLKELVKEKIIFDHLIIELKSGKKKEVSIKSLTTFDITRRIKNLRFTEKIKNRV